MVNTGVEAELLATVDMATHYSKARSGYYEDPNPIIEPNGYFYLTNNREIFDREYCGGNGNYGHSQKTVIPVFELPDEDWGILYDVTRVRGAGAGPSALVRGDRGRKGRENLARHSRHSRQP